MLGAGQISVLVFVCTTFALLFELNVRLLGRRGFGVSGIEEVTVVEIVLGESGDTSSSSDDGQ